MKNTILTVFVGFIAFIILQSFDTNSLKKVDGTEPGYTGSPGDSLKNCTVCHGGNAVNIGGWITSDIPESGYVPGTKYRITATNTSQSHNRFGFSVSPQNITGTMLGTLVVTDTTRTKLNGGGKYITYRPAGVPNDDKAIWEFDWIAPSDTVNEVVFYGAFNSNQDGHKGGDLTRLSNLKVFKQGFTGLADFNKGLNLSVYPNPCSDYLEVSMQIMAANDAKISLYRLNGQLVTTLFNGPANAGSFQSRFDVSQVEAGLYLVQTETGNKQAWQKVLLVR
ncbi:MAG: choice-of-anchor V domain-containing protein [bacterium]|nr:choice-of-anchor V domain-containing protein [bacterium]